jgi:hypothetical protein
VGFIEGSPHSTERKPVPSGFYSEAISRRKQQKLEKEGRDNHMAFLELTVDVDELMAGSRQKGVYKAELANLNGQRAVEVDLTNGVFKGKKAASVAIGFRTAIKADADFEAIRVVTQTDEKGTDHVYLINQAVEAA